ncbi:MAG: xylan 1,4-beta-xylosidase [Bacteroidales bacterium]|nr:xylan 1,4-beta-xylosidase [Bacteroidales bacterium]MBQ9173687.1 xylan 1,4-beta-xylosidase [Bacteroidales bacterium]MBQ9712989.1 xylan 1,4-beta-xylosidase [Bacteroidales bacterium]MBR6415128.1 xylan 1,4-beta-xylosidase [Bacteroidales bacterium]
MGSDRFDIKQKEGLNILTDAVVIVDKETGVNYLFVHRGYGGGLTPLVDADGKPIVTKDFNKDY